MTCNDRNHVPQPSFAVEISFCGESGSPVCCVQCNCYEQVDQDTGCEIGPWPSRGAVWRFRKANVWRSATRWFRWLLGTCGVTQWGALVDWFGHGSAAVRWFFLLGPMALRQNRNVSS